MLIAPVNGSSDLFKWETTLFPLEDSSFVGGVFKLFIRFNLEYSLKLPKINVFYCMISYIIVMYAPLSFMYSFLLTLRFSMYKIQFQNEVFHPNLHMGGISFDILLEKWTPALSISDVCLLKQLHMIF